MGKRLHEKMNHEPLAICMQQRFATPLNVIFCCILLIGRHILFLTVNAGRDQIIHITGWYLANLWWIDHNWSMSTIWTQVTSPTVAPWLRNLPGLPHGLGKIWMIQQLKWHELTIVSIQTLASQVGVWTSQLRWMTGPCSLSMSHHQQLMLGTFPS